MITGAQQTITVAPPAVARGGVLAVANVQDVEGHALLGAQYETMACADARTWEEFCTTPGTWVNCEYTPPEGGLKVFDQAPSWVESLDPFAVYAGVECDFQRREESEERARRALAYGERREVDKAVITAIDSVAIEITTDPADPSLGQAIGAAELYIATAYGGVATLLIPLNWAAIAARDNFVMIDVLTGRATTALGSNVAFFVPGTEDTEGRIYATGQITLLRGPINSFSTPDQICDGEVVPPRALAERIYVPLVECLSAYIEVDPAKVDCPCG